jgi:Lon protease-like protein
VGSTIEACFFPLEGVVFFPSATLPLNIFEPRYLSMTDHLLERGLPLVLSDLDPTEPGAWSPGKSLIAGMGAAHLFEQRPDGTKVILVRGTHRVRLVSVLQENPFIRCQVEPLVDEAVLNAGNIFFLQRLKQGLAQWAEETLPDAESKQAFQAGLENAPKVVELYSHYRVQDVDIRQQILELSDINHRIDLLRRVL